MRQIRTTLFEQARALYENQEFAEGDSLLEKMKETDEENKKLLGIFFNQAKLFISEEELTR